MSLFRSAPVVLISITLAACFTSFSNAEEEKREVFVSRIAQISTYHCHNLLLEKDGTVWTWGYNRDGRLGLGKESIMEAPLKIPNLTDVVAVSAGCDHSLVLKKDGTIWAWGSNNNGQLGDGTRNPSNVPKQIENFDGVIAIAAGHEYSLALKQDGTVWAWGLNAYQCLPNHFDDDYLYRPQQYPELRDVKAIAAGSFIAACIKSDGKVFVWNFQCNEIDWKTFPMEIPALEGAVQISTGGNHLIARKKDGSVWTWGKNGMGLLGNDDLPAEGPILREFMIEELDGASYVGCSLYNSLVLGKDGSVWLWGWNQQGLMENDTTEYCKKPTKALIEEIELVSLSVSHVIAADKYGNVWTWGSNENGDLGIPKDDGKEHSSRHPVKLFELKEAVENKGK